MDFLQQANQELEGKLADAMAAKKDLEAEVAQLRGKNARICSELEEIGTLVKQMEAERKEGEGGLMEEIGQLKVRIAVLCCGCVVCVVGVGEEVSCSGLVLPTQAERGGLVAAKSKLDECVRGLEEKVEELRHDNQHMAEMLTASEVEAKKMSLLMEQLSQEKLQQQLKASKLMSWS